MAVVATLVLVCLVAAWGRCSSEPGLGPSVASFFVQYQEVFEQEHTSRPEVHYAVCKTIWCLPALPWSEHTGLVRLLQGMAFLPPPFAPHIFLVLLGLGPRRGLAFGLLLSCLPLDSDSGLRLQFGSRLQVHSSFAGFLQERKTRVSVALGHKPCTPALRRFYCGLSISCYLSRSPCCSPVPSVATWRNFS